MRNQPGLLTLVQRGRGQRRQRSTKLAVQGGDGEGDGVLQLCEENFPLRPDSGYLETVCTFTQLNSLFPFFLKH